MPTLVLSSPNEFKINENPAPEISVSMSFEENNASSTLSYGYDPYGTQLPGFPSMNNNGDISGQASYSYIDPITGKEKNQNEAAVWVNGNIHRFGVFYCDTSNCQSRALKIDDSRKQIIGASHGIIAGTTPYFERSIKWYSDNNDWLVRYGLLDNSIQSYIIDINGLGNIVGSAINSENYIRHAEAVIDNKKYIIGPYANKSSGAAINNQNEVVGSIEIDGSQKAFRWDLSIALDSPVILPSIGGNYSIASDINDNQLIVGAASTENNEVHAVSWKNDEVLQLGTLGGQKSIARSVNNQDTIVGYSETEFKDKHAFIYMDNQMFDLNDFVVSPSGWMLVDAYSVNNNGQILVRAQKNKSHASEDNAYWVLSPEGFINAEGPVMLAGNAYCQWGKTDCEIEYPPAPAVGNVYKMPSGDLPVFPISTIPSADAYVCHSNCEFYNELEPQFSSINEAINNTMSNEKIVVLPGLYNESITVTARIIQGLSREYTIISTEGLNQRPITMRGRVELSNLAITGGNTLDGGGIQIAGGFNIIKNCIVQGNIASRDGGGIHGLMRSSFILRDSVVSQNKASYGGGYVSWGFGNADMQHNKIVNNEAVYGGGVFIASYADIFFNANVVDGNFASRDGGGVYVNSYTYDKYVRNSLITNNRSGRYGGGVYRGGVLGSVVYGNESGVTKYSAVFGSSVRNSILWGNAGTHAASGVYNSIVENSGGYCSYCSEVINKDPLFVDPQNGDFRLSEGSPAIDSGMNTSEVYGQWSDDDFNGVIRGVDGDGLGSSAEDDYDIGAFEYNPNN